MKEPAVFINFRYIILLLKLLANFIRHLYIELHDMHCYLLKYLLK